DDVGERGLAQPGRAREQHVVQRPAPLLGRGHVDAEVVGNLPLPHELVEGGGAQSQLVVLGAGGALGGDHALGARGRLAIVVALAGHVTSSSARPAPASPAPAPLWWRPASATPPRTRSACNPAPPGRRTPHPTVPPARRSPAATAPESGRPAPPPRSSRAARP